MNDIPESITLNMLSQAIKNATPGISVLSSDQVSEKITEVIEQLELIEEDLHSFRYDGLVASREHYIQRGHQSLRIAIRNLKKSIR